MNAATVLRSWKILSPNPRISPIELKKRFDNASEIMNQTNQGRGAFPKSIFYWIVGQLLDNCDH